MYKVILEKPGSYRASQTCDTLSEAQGILIKDIGVIEKPLAPKPMLEMLALLEDIPVSIERGDHIFSIIEWAKPR